MFYREGTTAQDEIKARLEQVRKDVQHFESEADNHERIAAQNREAAAHARNIAAGYETILTTQE